MGKREEKRNGLRNEVKRRMMQVHINTRVKIAKRSRKDCKDCKVEKKKKKNKIK